MRPQPLIAVHDVEASSKWYRSILRSESGHGGPEYDILMHDGCMVMQLHRWDAHDHPHMGDPAIKPYGNGTLLWFEVDDFDAVVVRAGDQSATVLEPPHVNENARHREVWLRDPDGYVVVVASPFGDMG